MLKPDTIQHLKDSVENLRDDFDFLVKNVIETEEDAEVFAEAIDKAFSCVPSCSAFPSQQAEAQRNQAIAMASLEEFASRVRKSS